MAQDEPDSGIAFSPVRSQQFPLPQEPVGRRINIDQFLFLQLHDADCGNEFGNGTCRKHGFFIHGSMALLVGKATTFRCFFSRRTRPGTAYSRKPINELRFHSCNSLKKEIVFPRVSFPIRYPPNRNSSADKHTVFLMQINTSVSCVLLQNIPYLLNRKICDCFERSKASQILHKIFRFGNVKGILIE